MDLIELIYQAFKKVKKDPKDYLEFKDSKKTGALSEVEFRKMIFDFCKLSFTQKEVDTLLRRYEHATKRSHIDIQPLIEDLTTLKKKDVDASSKKILNQTNVFNPKTPAEKLGKLKYSTRCPFNVPGYKSYSMKNTACGRQGVTKKPEKVIIDEFEFLLEEIMKQTFLNDKLVEDHFRAFSKHSDLEYDEFKKAMEAINLSDNETDLKDLYESLRGKNKRAYIEDIDFAVESTVKRNIEECQKLILDDVYSSLKSDPLITFETLFDKFKTSGSNKITFVEFVSTLEPKCLNVEASNLLLLAKRYCTKYDDEVYFKDLVTDLEKLSRNVDPIKEWIADVCTDIQKSLVCKSESLYKFFVTYAGKDDQLDKTEFNRALRALKLDEIYTGDKLDEFYYY